MKVKAFAKRSTTSSIIQGTAADIFRIAFVNMYKNFFSKYPDDIKFQIAVHDEIDFRLSKKAIDMSDEIVEVLRLKRRDWPVAMDVGTDIGYSWGTLVPFHKVDGKWVPEEAK